MTQENENQPKKHLLNNKIDDIYSFKVKDEKNVVKKRTILNFSFTFHIRFNCKLA